jgi:hypothetical protein
MNCKRALIAQKKDELEQRLLVADSMVERYRIVVELEQVEVDVQDMMVFY